ncbi:MAG: HAMP domain-containing histidine kinase [Bacteroidales bacterium]|nr:HAMP domain-containing histidine kinase [Bacteroidales bacterium]
MNKKIIFFIITLISLSLIGLMFIQVHWINNAITVRQTTFVRDVNEAVSNVIFQIEKIEMSEQIKNRFTNSTNKTSILQSIDSINNSFLEDIQSINTNDDFQKLVKRSFMTQNLIEEMFNIKQNRPIDERINKDFLDSLINTELGKKGINTLFEFAVFNSARNSMIMQKTGKYPEKLLKHGFVFTLFPNDIIANPNYLIVFFPNEKQFIISQMWVLLFVSAILIIIIIVSFALTISTIFRQKKLSKMKNDFINNMTHEFKTPISTVSLACEALSDTDIKKSEQLYSNYIKIISEENSRLGVIAEKILQTAILEKGQLNLKKEEIDVNEIISDVVKNIKIQVEIKDGKIEEFYNADFSKIVADKIHITNVFYNLLDNANKYSPKKPEIKVITENSAKGIIIKIEDNGIGISKANQKKIFGKLFRVPTGDVHDFKGYGLGLSYVKKIIEKHGGKISVDSELNTGSRFTIFLPLYLEKH